MKIPLINSDESVEVTNEDYPLVSRLSWFLVPDGYAATFIKGVEVPLEDVLSILRIRRAVEQYVADSYQRINNRY